MIAQMIVAGESRPNNNQPSVSVTIPTQENEYCRQDHRDRQHDKVDQERKDAPGRHARETVPAGRRGQKAWGCTRRRCAQAPPRPQTPASTRRRRLRIGRAASIRFAPPVLSEPLELMTSPPDRAFSPPTWEGTVALPEVAWTLNKRKFSVV